MSAGKPSGSQLKAIPVPLEELKKLASQGAFRKRGRKPKYRTFLEDFKKSSEIAIKSMGLSVSEVAQVARGLSEVFGQGGAALRTLDVVGEGKSALYDILLIKKRPETETILHRRISKTKANR